MMYGYLMWMIVLGLIYLEAEIVILMPTIVFYHILEGLVDIRWFIMKVSLFLEGMDSQTKAEVYHRSV